MTGSRHPAWSPGQRTREAVAIRASTRATAVKRIAVKVSGSTCGTTARAEMKPVAQIGMNSAGRAPDASVDGRGSGGMSAGRSMSARAAQR
jgi:hypothetical protein